MKWARFLFPAIVLFCAGCAGIGERDRVALQRHGVSAMVEDKMLHGDWLSLNDIVELSQRGLSPQFIIRYLDATAPVYRLSSSDVVQLRHAGVSPEVIDYLLATPEYYARRVYYAPYPYYPYPTVFVAGGFHHFH